MRIFKRHTKLDRVWYDCERLWEWVSSQWVKKHQEIVGLKARWFICHPFKIRSGGESHCFFCTHATKAWYANIGNRPERFEEWTSCDYCPGKLVDPEFSCMDNIHHYRFHPDLFYEEIKRLNILRKQQEIVGRSHGCPHA